MSSLFRLAHEARRHGDFYFAALLPEDSIRTAFGEAIEDFQAWLYTPVTLIWCFLAQVMSADHSCCETVARLIAFRVSRGQRPCSPDTGGYCTARNKLPEDACQRLVEQTAEDIVRRTPATWRWHERRVLVCDGTTLTMADTAANQAAYPQPDSQAAGCGFPRLRLVALFCLATGVALRLALDRYTGKQTGEASLCRSLSDYLQSGDVFLGDRIFCGWFDIALQQQRGVDVVLRKYHSRRSDFRTGQRLGKDDHVIAWPKPARPQWMDQATYDALPAELVVRELRKRVTQRGFRTREVIVITTLLDPVEYATSEIADLYRRRWLAELNLRSLKCTLQMDHLRCKEPHRVRNELRMHFLAYNLLRGVMAEAARQAGVPPWRISFKAALQTINEFLRMLPATRDVSAWCEALLACLAEHAVGGRPDRVEPRRRKRRPKNYPPLQRHRHTYRNRPEP